MAIIGYLAVDDLRGFWAFLAVGLSEVSAKSGVVMPTYYSSSSHEVEFDLTFRGFIFL